MLISVLATIFLRLLIIFVILFFTSRRVGHRIHSGISIVIIPIFTNICIHVRLGVCVLLNTVPLVCGIDAGIKVCINSYMDNDTSTSANICTHIFVLILVLELMPVTLFIGNIDVGTNICIRISI